jgi:hypothetical protein
VSVRLLISVLIAVAAVSSTDQGHYVCGDGTVISVHARSELITEADLLDARSAPRVVLERTRDLVRVGLRQQVYTADAAVDERENFDPARLQVGEHI